MDIAALSAGMNQMRFAQEVGVRVAKLSMESAQTQSNEMVKMLEQSVQPHLGQGIDLKV